MREPCHVRQQLCSNGILRTWKWPMSLGEEYFGPKVVMTEVRVELTSARVTELQEKERRTKLMNSRIRRECQQQWAIGVQYLKG